ncbi:MAG: hypothetical protein D6765_10205, partial [Bacteroidetes bacterium]
GLLFARLFVSGQPLIGDRSSAADGLALQVRYLSLNGAPLDPTRLPQGTDFLAEVRVRHTSPAYRRLEELALTQVFPSGWEILNTRLFGLEGWSAGDRPEYQDLRDDRVYSYFDLGKRNEEKVFRVQLHAAYEGRFYLPTLRCSAMYDESIHARVPGQWVEVVAPENL